MNRDVTKYKWVAGSEKLLGRPLIVNLNISEINRLWYIKAEGEGYKEKHLFSITVTDMHGGYYCFSIIFIWFFLTIGWGPKCK